MCLRPSFEVTCTIKLGKILTTDNEAELPVITWSFTVLSDFYKHMPATVHKGSEVGSLNI